MLEWIKSNPVHASAVFSLITGIFIFGAFVVSLLTHWFSKRTLKLQTFLNLRKEYRSNEIGRIIDRLWTMYRKSEKNSDSLAERYYDTCKHRDRTDLQCIHYQRRKISQLYQQLENLWRSRIITKRLIYTYWSKIDLEIIPNIITPIETIAGQRLIDREPLKEDKYPKWIKRLIKLYKKAPDRRDEHNNQKSEV